MNEKIKLQDYYPYTYVRVITMKAKLLDKDDYNRLLKMGFSEIAKYLQDSEYKKEINELAIKLSGADLIEAALNNNLAATFTKLWRISPDELDLLIDAYVKRYDFFNIKTVIRGKFTGMANEDIKNVLKPVGLFGVNNTKEDKLNKMLEETSIEKILELTKIFEKKKIKELCNRFAESKDLVDVENAIDKEYIKYIIEFSQRIPKQGHLFKEFLMNEVDISNIKQILRMKKEGLSEDQIKKHISLPMKIEGISSLNIKKEQYNKILKQDYNEMIKTLVNTKFKAIVKKNLTQLEAKGSLVGFENDLDKYLLKKSLTLLHQNPLSIDIILGYMFAKEVEVSNLKKLVKAKQLEMEEDFISKQLIV
jgi:V/A-type H+/Na+-transporting ATPase subunit C